MTGNGPGAGNFQRYGDLLDSGDREALLQAYLSRLHSQNPSLKAFVSVKDGETLLKELLELKGLAGGMGLPLRGVPVGVKDMFHVRGFPTAGGSRHTQWPLEDAAMVKKLKAAGCVVVGKTNMHELAHGITGENPHYGRVANPWDPGRMSGGSSSGSAAAVAAGLVPLATGSDTGGSIRIPAAYCGIFGFKPSRGFLSMEGCLPLSPSLDHPGLFALTMADLVQAVQVLAPEPMTLPSPKKAKKIGVPYHFFRPYVEEETEKQLPAFLAALGGEAEPLDIPFLEEVYPAAFTVVFREAYENHGHLLKEPELLGGDVRRCLEIGGEVPLEAYHKGLKFQEAFREEMGTVLSRYDFLVIPSVPGPAPPAGTRKLVLHGTPYNLAFPLTLLNYPASFGGFPALGVPWRAAGKLPLGFQVIAGADAPLLAFALERFSN